jgi:hypothetical protein
MMTLAVVAILYLVFGLVFAFHASGVRDGWVMRPSFPCAIFLIVAWPLLILL